MILQEIILNEYYMSLAKIKDFNALISKKPCLEQPVKSKPEAYEKFVEMSKNNDYITGNVLDYLYHQKYYYITGNVLDYLYHQKYY